MNTSVSTGESGGARLKFIIVIAIIGIIGYAGYIFVPVFYDSYLLKDLMQHDVDMAVAAGYPPSWVRDQLVKAGKEYNVPADASIEPAMRDNRMEVRVQFVRPVVFPLFTYQYNFDHTVRSTTFLTFK